MTSTQPTERRVSVSWIGDHRRSREIAVVGRASPEFIHRPAKVLPIRYLRQHRATRAVLRAQRPDLVIVMQPPPVALFSVVCTVPRSTVIVGDLHSGVFFDPKWRWARRWVLRVLRRRGFAVVPNIELAELCEQQGVPVVVSHGILSESEPVAHVAPSGSRPLALVPFTYAHDEPVAELLAAAADVPDVEWVLTGRAPDRVREAAPANVRFTGFVSREEYEQLRRKATVVLALTTLESTMQSAGYEAIALGTPLVTSDTRVLRDYFADAAVYVRPNPREIARAVEEVIAAPGVYQQRMVRRRSEIIADESAVAVRFEELAGLARERASR